MPDLDASHSTAPGKSRCSTSRTNVIASPDALQPKQWYRPSDWFTEKLGDFSLWNGHRPDQRWPTRLSCV